MGNDTSPVELLQGTADLLILRTLVFGPSHGHAIPSRPRHLAGRAAGRDRLALPPLDRLEAQGWVISVWQPSDKGKRAKYYAVTAIGRQQLIVEQSKWEQLSLAMARILRLATLPLLATK